MATAKALQAVPQAPTNIEIVQITPATAAEYLTHNTHNRSYRERRANQYARDMKHGRWRWNGVPIAFDVNGVLIEGQHRLHAIIKAGVTLPMAVVRGLPPETQETYDRAAFRSVSDALTLRGKVSTMQLAAVGRRVWEWIENGPSWNFAGDKEQRPTQAEILDLIEGDPTIQEAVNYVVTVRKYVDARPSVMGLAYWVFHQIDPAQAGEFFHDLYHQANLPPHDPVLALIRRLREESTHANRHGGRLDNEAQMALFIHAWNARREGRPIQRMILRPDKEYPRPR